MVVRFCVFLIICVFQSPLWAFSCYFTLAKDSCWTNYSVTVDVVDASTHKSLFTLEVPSGTSWVRHQFNCEPAQKLMYFAHFSPVFWKGDEGKTYSALRYWSLPGAVNSGDTAWTINVCYPADFSEVPFPPDAPGHCVCDFNSIPAIKP